MTFGAIGGPKHEAADFEGKSGPDYISKESPEKQTRKSKSSARFGRWESLAERWSEERREATLTLMESGLESGGQLDESSRRTVSEIFSACEPGSPLYERAQKILEGGGEGWAPPLSGVSQSTTTKKVPK